MNKTTAYLDRVKVKAGIKTNYALHKLLEVSEQDLSDCYKEKKHADVYICTRVALALGIEPMTVIAEIQEEAARTITKRHFWQSFRTFAAVALVCLVVPVLGSGWPNVANASTARTTGRSAHGDVTANYARLRSALRRAVASLFGTWETRAFAPA